jgi:Peptidase family M1 domain
MKKIILGIFAGVVVLNAGLNGALSRQVANYDIKARLVPATKTIEATETLAWTNDSGTAVSELPFHLYMNAFKNNRTTFMKESGGLHRGFKSGTDDWGKIDVSRIGIAGGADLTGTMTFLRPDDGNPDDQTVMQVTLPAPVGPGERIVLEIAFATRLPKVFARSGYSGEFYMVGQWFPKIGVIRNGAWDRHQYHANSEFFADFGAYRVEITVPEKYVVGATGRRESERKNADGTKTLVHVQEDVHDFAWTACPDFVESRERFVLDDPPVDTEMILLVHKAHLKSRDRYALALRRALEFFSRSYGPYPYATVTLVDPAPGAAGAGGMEYPTLFTAGTTSWMPAGVRMPEMVTIHEFGHGYWYGIVASNEFEEAWLDEGINSYSEVKAMEKYYGEGRSMIDIGGMRLGDLASQRLRVIGSGRFDPVLKESWNYVNGSSYGINVYAKAALMMLTLERWLGEDVMTRIMRTYYERWKFRHPTSEDFIRIAEEVSGRDLGWFFDQTLRSPDKLDYAVSELSSREVNEPRGLFDIKRAEPVADEKAGKGRKAAAAKPKTYRNLVVAARYGEWVFPQEVLVTFEDGRKVRENWDGKDRWKRFVYEGPVKVVSAEIDPDRKLLLDVNHLNNSRTTEPARTPVRKASLGLLRWLQGLLSLVSL